MKQRNIAVCILLLFVTCGIYGIYWMIVLNDETNALSGRIGTSGGTVFLFWMYQMGNAVEMLHEQHGEPRGSAPVVYLLLSLFGFSIVAYALLQYELNKYLPDA